LLMAGDGVANSRIATALGISRPTVLNWRGRFLADGLGSVGEVRPGRGRKPEITVHQVKAIVHATLHETPPGATHWSCRSMAKAAGVSRSTVQRIWDAHGLQPRDPQARVGSPLAGGSPALRTALHADGSLVAQPRR